MGVFGGCGSRVAFRSGCFEGPLGNSLWGLWGGMWESVLVSILWRQGLYTSSQSLEG